MSVRSKVLAQGQAALLGANIAYTVPAAETALIKSVGLWAPTAQTIDLQMRRTAVGGGRPLLTVALAANVAQLLEFWVAAHPDDRFEIVKAALATPVQFWISGAELEGVAD